MTYQDIYDISVRLLGEPGDNPGIADYFSRSPSLMAMVDSELANLSTALGNKSPVPCARVEFSDDFRLDARLAYPSAAKLAARLVFDRQPELASALDLFAEAQIKRLSTGLCSVESTREVY